MLDLILENESVLLNEHALLLLGEDLSLILAQSVLPVHQALHGHVARETLIRLGGTVELLSLRVRCPLLTELEQSGQQRTI